VAYTKAHVKKLFDESAHKKVLARESYQSIINQK
jgi:hypothetical protein